jgi:hypothetical protein
VSKLNEKTWETASLRKLLEFVPSVSGARSKYRSDLRRKQILLACAIARTRWDQWSGRTRYGFELLETEEDAPPNPLESKMGVQPDPTTFEACLGQDVTRADYEHEVVAIWALLASSWDHFLSQCPVRKNNNRWFRTDLWANTVRDIFGNPFRPLSFDPAWRTDTAVSLARTMYDRREFGAMPILADALQDAGCESEPILAHCRDPHATHVRGCWVCDLVLGM